MPFWGGGMPDEHHGGYVTQTEFVAAMEHMWDYVLQQTDAINKLGADQVATQADIDALTTQVQTLDSQVTTLTGQLQAQDSQVQNAITNINAEIAALQQANPALDVSGLQSAVAQLATDQATEGAADEQLATDVSTVDTIAPQPGG
jgi:outer membrane murein-binding lipoprotein Lpp